jgi:hypothetical protein
MVEPDIIEARAAHRRSCTEAVQALLRLLEADGRIASAAERTQAAALVASVEAGNADQAEPAFHALFGFASAPFKKAAWAILEALIAKSSRPPRP